MEYLAFSKLVLADGSPNKQRNELENRREDYI